MIYRLTDSHLVATADFALSGVHTELLCEGLAEVNAQSGNAVDVQTVIAHAVDGRLRNFVILSNGEPVGFTLYHITKSPYDTYTAMHLIAMYVKPNHAQATTALIDFLKNAARDLGAGKVVGISRRKGWARRMKPDLLLQLGVWDV
jgi:hypothetical protein